MQRLVYSPTVKAMIRTRDGVIDISDYIVSGTVNRVLNEVSTAELIIRNPYKKFTTKGNPTFRPMDDIQIWGSRYKDHPVQLFTGYLDTTPYLQLFPGTCSLQASCTLKRLLHTYWDPGLPYVWNWLGKWGWQVDPTSGSIISPKQFTQSSGINASDGVSKQELNNALLTDGSVGNLLFNFLVDVGKWKGSKDPNESQVLIEKLPDGIVSTVSAMMEQYQKDDAETEAEVKKFFSDLIGQYTPGSTSAPSGDIGGGTTGSADLSKAPKALRDFPRKKVYTKDELVKLCRAAGFPDPAYAADVSFCESAGGQSDADSPIGGVNTGSSSGNCCCHGLWQLYLGNSPVDNSVFSCDKKGLDNANDPLVSTWYVAQYIKGGGSWFPWDCATGRR
jgi:hypothetical protein